MGKIRVSPTGILKLVLTALILVIIVFGVKLLIDKFASKDSAQVASGVEVTPEVIDGHNRLEEIMLGNTSKMLYGLRADDFEIEQGTIEKGESFSRLLSGRYNLGMAIVSQLVEKSNGIFELKDLRAGSTFTAFFTPDSTQTLQYLVYNKSNTEYVTFCCLPQAASVKADKVEITIRERYCEGVINSSLSATIAQNNLPISLANSLDNIFKWTIDFFALQKGDSFRVIYEEMVIDTVSVGVGNIYGAEFTHAGKTYLAVKFEQGDDKGYWDQDGVNLRKAFLKAPLSYKARVSSKFGLRTHPITRQRGTQHNGIDYACPTGTPVQAVANGTVTVKSFERGGGNYIWIKHEQGLESGYLHLSRFASGLNKGSRVSQGQVIGYVGSTGMSTGPHLDFRIRKSGKYVDPTKMQSLPSNPINGAHKATFDVMKKDVVKAMEEYKAGKAL